MSRISRIAALIVLTALGTSSSARAQATVRETVRNGDVVAGKLDLPGDGLWRAVEPETGAAVRFVFLLPSKEALDAFAGTRSQRIAHRKRIAEARRQIRGFFWALRDHAEKHNNLGPARIEDLDAEQHRRVIENMTRSPWLDDRRDKVEGPFYFLIPNVPIPNDRIAPEDAQPLVLELRPYLDNGKHLVLLNNGQVKEREIDAELVKKHTLTIRPFTKTDETRKTPETFEYTITALCPDIEKAGAATIELRNEQTGKPLRCVWEPAGAADGPETIRKTWANQRSVAWSRFAAAGDAQTLWSWIAIDKRRHGADGIPLQTFVNNRRRNDRSTSVFGVLGGRAAVRETLQMQLLSDADRVDDAPRMLKAIEGSGVKVKSHPFEEMLGGREGGRLLIADAVPPDRFMVHFGKPADMLKMLDSGGAFLSKLGGALTRNNIRYGLAPHSIERLGLTEAAARAFVENNIIRELAITCPDLFLIDGTDLTVIARVPQLRAAAPVLAMIGIRNLGGETTTVVPTRDGGQAFWVARGDLLVMSTNLAELDAVKALIAADGTGSLGRSAEFRYMLTQLPVEENTVAYAYFSDPFIRRLVGPHAKIGQLRRMQTRAELETMTAAALLYKADGNAGVPTREKLIEMDYLPKTFTERDYVLHENLVAESLEWGTPANLKPLSANPVDQVTEAEAKAYDRYVQNYTRFWRQFFDPIAVRLDRTGETGASLTTFILPLLDSQVYEGVRTVLADKDSKTPLRVPRVEPAPVLTLSANLTAEAWIEVLDEIEDLFTRFTRIDPSLLDRLGPGAHLCVMDANPIISLGSGDILGAFGGRMMQRGVGMAAPAFTLLTRPCKLMVELDDPDAVRDILNRAAAGMPRTRGWFEVDTDFYRAAERDAWGFDLSVAGVVKLRFGVEVQDKYLVISNLPSGNPVHVTRGKTEPLNGAAIRVAPAAVNKELGALYASAQENRRTAAVQGMAYLYPLMVSGSPTTGDAAARHAALFGFAPVHPAGGAWVWENGELRSTLYGTSTHARQPEHKPGERDFGLLGGIEEFGVNLQLEDTGLRTLLRWNWRADD